MSYDQNPSVGRYQYVYNQRASLNLDGGFKSSDGPDFFLADYRIRPQRMMKIAIDGNLRVYSFIEHLTRKEWQVQWQIVSRSCRVHGICETNSLCTYSQDVGRRCICLHGYKMVNFEDWSYGCAPEFEGCSPDNEGFIKLT
ncbi:unnamed protein product [Lactuca saligna]|uniref:S-locus glycoprotein domain-containing protein n=1 Tax=Lactuca saligna TaxID=75948 RepID=A0AA36EFN9_LACSI|nr:unnamed protein product [Lactuca saligna]